MLQIVVPEQEFYNEEDETFVKKPSVTLRLEHSLISIAKWEAKWEIPYLSTADKTTEQVIDYIRCMTVDKVDPEVYERLSLENMKNIQEYITAKMTATWFTETPSPSHREIITSEIIYYWMIELGIPAEYQKWHINRLLALVRTINEKRKPAKKMSTQDMIAQRKALNEARLKKYNTHG